MFPQVIIIIYIKINQKLKQNLVFVQIWFIKYTFTDGKATPPDVIAAP